MTLKRMIYKISRLNIFELSTIKILVDTLIKHKIQLMKMGNVMINIDKDNKTKITKIKPDTQMIKAFENSLKK